MLHHGAPASAEGVTRSRPTQWMQVNKSRANRSWTKNSNAGTGGVGSGEHTHRVPSLAQLRLSPEAVTKAR